MTVHLAFVLLAHATVVGAIRADCDSLNVHTFLPPKALALLEPFGWTVGTDPEICVCDLQARLDDLAPKLVQLHPDHGGDNAKFRAVLDAAPSVLRLFPEGWLSRPVPSSKAAAFRMLVTVVKELAAFLRASISSTCGAPKDAGILVSHLIEDTPVLSSTALVIPELTYPLESTALVPSSADLQPVLVEVFVPELSEDTATTTPVVPQVRVIATALKSLETSSVTTTLAVVHGAAEFITPPPSVSVFPKVIVGATYYAPPVTNDGLTRMALVVEHDTSSLFWTVWMVPTICLVTAVLYFRRHPSTVTVAPVPAIDPVPMAAPVPSDDVSVTSDLKYIQDLKVVVSFTLFIACIDRQKITIEALTSWWNDQRPPRDESKEVEAPAFLTALADFIVRQEAILKDSRDKPFPGSDDLLTILLVAAGPSVLTQLADRAPHFTSSINSFSESRFDFTGNKPHRGIPVSFLDLVNAQLRRPKFAAAALVVWHRCHEQVLQDEKYPGWAGSFRTASVVLLLCTESTDKNSLFVDFHDRCYCFTDAAACRHVEPGNFYRADLHPAPVVHNSRISVNTLRMIDDPPTVGMIISTKIAAFHDIPDSEWPQRVAWLHSTGNHFFLKTLQNSAPFESLRLGVEFQCEIVKVGYYDNASKGFLEYELKPVTPPAGAPDSGLADLGGTGNGGHSPGDQHDDHGPGASKGRR